MKIKREEAEKIEKSNSDLEIEFKMKGDDVINYIPQRINDEFEENFNINFNDPCNMDIENDLKTLDRCDIKIDNDMIRNLNLGGPTINRMNQLITNDNLTTTNTPIEFTSKEKFRIKLRDMRTSTEFFIDGIKNNFINYMDNQKNHLMGCLSLIEDIADLNQGNVQTEEAKNRTIDKKLEDFTKELNIMVNDLHKFIR